MATSEADHRHCKVCGRVCDPDKLTCSPKCAQERARVARVRRNYLYMIYGTAALLLLLLVTPYLGRV